MAKKDTNRTTGVPEKKDRKSVTGFPAKKDPKGAILDAAMRVLHRKGLSGITIEAVAIESGMSKGGVLHYFPNKEQLLSGTVKRQVDRIIERRDELLPTLSDRPCALATATMTATIEYLDGIVDELPSGIAVLGEPVYREIVGDMKRKIYREIAACAKHPEKAAVVLYMLDGAWINRLFKPSSSPRKVEAKAMDIIRELMDSCCL